MKRLYRAGGAATDPAALAAERAVLVEHLVTSPAPAEGLAAFAERREPDFG